MSLKSPRAPVSIVERTALLAVVRGGALPAEDVDWRRVLALADVNGLLPLFARSEAVGRLPAEQQRQLRVLSAVIAARNQEALRELARLAAAFQAARVPLLTWKGPLLADQAYGDPSLRVFTDLDLIVSPRDVERAEDLLHALGYRATVALTRAQRATQHRFGNARVLMNAERTRALDLHWRFGNAAFPLPLSFDAAWQRRVDWTVAGFSLPTLGAEDLTLVVAVHAAKHLWSKLEHLTAAARLAERPLAWSVLDALGEQLHLCRALGLTFLLARRFAGGVLPPLPRSLAAAEAALPAVAALVEEQLFGASAPQHDARPAQTRYLIDRVRDRAAALATAVFVPTYPDWSVATLPGWMYWPLRPARLAVRSLARLVGRGP